MRSLFSLLVVIFLIGCGRTSPTAPSSARASRRAVSQPPAEVVACTTDLDCETKNPDICGGPYEPVCEVEPARLATGPQHHNIPAVFAGNETGPVIWLCATQPRLVCEDNNSPSRCALEEDHYLQYAPCPDTPIQ